MHRIYTSASKLAFILMVVAVIGAMFMGKISGEQFLGLAGMAFAFYFTKSIPASKVE